MYASTGPGPAASGSIATISTIVSPGSYDDWFSVALNGMSTAANCAVTYSGSLLIVTVHVAPLGLSQPIQPAKDQPADAAAVKTNTVPALGVSMQSPGQAIPGPETEPLPTISVKSVSAMSLHVRPEKSSISRFAFGCPAGVAVAASLPS